jgi:hypothetical protein
MPRPNRKNAQTRPLHFGHAGFLAVILLIGKRVWIRARGILSCNETPLSFTMWHRETVESRTRLCDVRSAKRGPLPLATCCAILHTQSLSNAQDRGSIATMDDLFAGRLENFPLTTDV